MTENTAPQFNRFGFLDSLRGIAVILMIIFHFTFDLSTFGYVDVDFFTPGGFWFLLPRFIVFLFFFCVGESLFLAYRKKIEMRKFFKKVLILAIMAGIISISTYIMYPTRWIYFGTLHCITLGYLLGLPFIRIPKASLILGLTLLTLSLALGIDIPWLILPHKSLDYIPLFPWFGVILIGIFMASVNFHEQKFVRLPRFLELPGRHSLLIYVAHQPILFGLVYMFAKMSGKIN